GTGGRASAGGGGPPPPLVTWPSGPPSSCGTAPGARPEGSLLLMVPIDLDALERADGGFRHPRGRAQQRQEGSGGAALIQPHEPHGQARADLAGDAGLEETDDPALLLAGAEQEDVGLVAGEVQLVARHHRQAAPRQELRAEERDSGRRDAAAGAL